jgi:DNA primase catalytic subunit
MKSALKPVSRELVFDIDMTDCSYCPCPFYADPLVALPADDSLLNR